MDMVIRLTRNHMVDSSILPTRPVNLANTSNDHRVKAVHHHRMDRASNQPLMAKVRRIRIIDHP